MPGTNTIEISLKPFQKYQTTFTISAHNHEKYFNKRQDNGRTQLIQLVQIIYSIQKNILNQSSYLLIIDPPFWNRNISGVQGYLLIGRLGIDSCCLQYHFSVTVITVDTKVRQSIPIISGSTSFQIPVMDLDSPILTKNADFNRFQAPNKIPKILILAIFGSEMKVHRSSEIPGFT